MLKHVKPLPLKSLGLLFSFIFISSCQGEASKKLPRESQAQLSDETSDSISSPKPDKGPGLMQVLRRIYQDKKGNLWFVGDEVFCYAGDSLIDFSQHEVFLRNVVRQIKEDEQGNIWFGTSNGLVKYEGLPGTSVGSFTKFTTENGLIHNDIWSLAIDKEGIIWIGTLEGVSQFNGDLFSHFDLPETTPDRSRGVTSARIVHHMMEDSKGNMWFGTNGGAYIFDGTSLSNIAENDGLCNNVVNDILEDQQGNIWFATHHQGVCFWDGMSFTSAETKMGLMGAEAWSLYEDQSGNIWFPIENAGVYRYDGSALVNFHFIDGFPMNGVHSIAEDKNGHIWLGGFEGLFRYDGKSFTAMTKESIWP